MRTKISSGIPANTIEPINYVERISLGAKKTEPDRTRSANFRMMFPKLGANEQKGDTMITKISSGIPVRTMNPINYVDTISLGAKKTEPERISSANFRMFPRGDSAQHKKPDQKR